MERIEEGIEDTREIIKGKLRQYFDGKIVRKDLTKKIKEGANVPVYVLEFLLGQYCSSDDEEVIEKGVKNVKKILADNFVRPDEAQKILSTLRAKGNYTIIDKVTVSLNIRKDQHEAEFSNLGLSGIPIEDSYPEKYDRLLCGGIWCIIQLEYVSESKLEGDMLSGIVDIDGNPVQSRKKKSRGIMRIRSNHFSRQVNISGSIPIDRSIISIHSSFENCLRALFNSSRSTWGICIGVSLTILIGETASFDFFFLD